MTRLADRMKKEMAARALRKLGTGARIARVLGPYGAVVGAGVTTYEVGTRVANHILDQQKKTWENRIRTVHGGIRTHRNRFH